MAASSLFSFLFYAGFGQKLFPKAGVVLREPKSVLMRLIPLALAFAVSMILSNEAYRYCSVPFLQMCKELNVVFVYLMALACGLEVFNVRQATLLFVVILGCSMAIHGEMRFLWSGFAIQITSQLCEALKITLQHALMSSQGYSLDPMSMVMFMCPICFVTSAVTLFFLWDPIIVALVREHWMLLALNCANAFLLNVAVACVIKFASGVAYVLAGIAKDILIVSGAVLIFSAALTVQQIVGFTIALFGIFLHAVNRTYAEDVHKHGMISVLGRLAKGTA